MNISVTSFPAYDRWNTRLVRELRYTGPASYVTGGDPVNASSELGLGEVYGVYGIISSGSAILVPFFDYANQKILWFVPNTGAQVANGVDLSTFSGTLLFTGKG